MTMSKSLFFVFIAANTIATTTASAAVEAPLQEAHQLCSFVNESTPTSLQCPPKQVVTSIDYAMFGSFYPSDCPNPVVTDTCPTPVIAQVELLCLGFTNCSVSCSCDADRDPACSCERQDVLIGKSTNSDRDNSLGGTLLSTGVPAFPCNGIRKDLAVIVTCGTSPTLVELPQLQMMTKSKENAAAADAPPTNLRLEFLDAPVLGMDVVRPHFAWTPSASASPQDAFQIDVTAVHNSTVVWSSGKVHSLSATHAAQTPLPLASDTVRVRRQI